MVTVAGLKSEFDAWCAAAKANSLFVPGIVGAACVTLSDQASKIWIVEVVRLREKRHIDLSAIFDLTWVQNFGASFGMLAGGLASRIFLSALSLSIALVLIGWLGRIDRKIAATGIAFVVGGAVGNLFDRVAYGYVIDFLDFSGLWFPWVFNIADTAICIGVGCLLLDAFLTPDGHHKGG